MLNVTSTHNIWKSSPFEFSLLIKSQFANASSIVVCIYCREEKDCSAPIKASVTQTLMSFKRDCTHRRRSKQSRKKAKVQKNPLHSQQMFKARHKTYMTDQQRVCSSLSQYLQNCIIYSTCCDVHIHYHKKLCMDIWWRELLCATLTAFSYL